MVTDYKQIYVKHNFSIGSTYKNFILYPISFFVLIFPFLIIGCGRRMNCIQIKGSDTMVNLVQAWAEKFSELNPGVNIAVTGGGSGTGIAAFISGTCDIVASSRKMKEIEINLSREHNLNPQEYIVALDGIAVVVHPENPVSRLTMEQLRDIFMGKIKNWKEVGGTDSNIVILSREINSGTHIFFKEHVLRRGKSKGTEEFAPEALLMPSSQAIVDEVIQNRSAIGYVGIGYLSDKLKAIEVSIGEGKPYIKPTIETVKKNIYPISRPLFLYTDCNCSPVVKKIIEFVFSDTGQKIVKDIDFIPVK